MCVKLPQSHVKQSEVKHSYINWHRKHPKQVISHGLSKYLLTRKHCINQINTVAHSNHRKQGASINQSAKPEQWIIRKRAIKSKLII